MSAAARGGAAGIAFEAGAVAQQGEVAAFPAAVTLVAFDARGANAFGPQGEGLVAFLCSRHRCDSQCRVADSAR